MGDEPTHGVEEADSMHAYRARVVAAEAVDRKRTGDIHG